MALQVTCPQCSAAFGAGPQLLGRRVKCPRCGGAIQIPAADPAESNRTKTPSAPKKKRSASTDEHANHPTATSHGDGHHASHAGSPEAVSVAALEHPDADDEGSVGFGKEQVDNAEMDMTPMVDVTFLLLIFFMVTASFSMQKTMEVPKSKTEEPSTVSIPQDPEKETESVTVIVDSYNTYTVETSEGFEEAPSEQELLIALRAARQTGSVTPNKLIVKAHVDSIHQKVVAALDAGADVGFEELQFVTITEDE